MDIQELKDKFKHKTQANIKDIDLALKAAPFLVREVEQLEKQLEEAEKRIKHLQKKRPPLSKKGKKGDAEWEVHIDEKKNRLHILFAGKFNYRSAKSASNSILTVITNVRREFDVISDISKMNANFDRKILFHMKKLMYTLEQFGVRKIVRVLNPEAPALAGIFEDKSKIDDIKIYSTNSVEEAESMLDSAGKFLKA